MKQHFFDNVLQAGYVVFMGANYLGNLSNEETFLERIVELKKYILLSLVRKYIEVHK